MFGVWCLVFLIESSLQHFRKQFSERLQYRQPFQPFNRVRRRNTARTNVAAIAQRVAAERARFVGDKFQPLAPGFVPRVHDEVERAVQRHRSQVARMQRH